MNIDVGKELQRAASALQEHVGGLQRAVSSLGAHIQERIRMASQPSTSGKVSSETSRGARMGTQGRLPAFALITGSVASPPGTEAPTQEASPPAEAPATERKKKKKKTKAVDAFDPSEASRDALRSSFVSALTRAVGPRRSQAPEEAGAPTADKPKKKKGKKAAAAAAAEEATAAPTASDASQLAQQAIAAQQGLIRKKPGEIGKAPVNPEEAYAQALARLDKIPLFSPESPIPAGQARYFKNVFVAEDDTQPFRACETVGDFVRKVDELEKLTTMGEANSRGISRQPLRRRLGSVCPA